MGSRQPPALEDVLDMARVARGMFGDFGPMMASTIEFAAGSLVRPGELFVLQWTDIDFERSLIRVGTISGGAGPVRERRTGAALIGLLPLARRALDSVPRVSDSPLVFRRPNSSQPINVRHYHHYWQQLRARYAEVTQRPEMLDLDFFTATRKAGAMWLRNVVGVSLDDLSVQANRPMSRDGRHPGAPLAADDRVGALNRVRELAEKHPLP